MSVPVYDPQISVVLKKNIGRANVGGDIAASTRFKGTARTIDLTPWLGDAGGVKVSKSARQPAGMFSIVLADRTEGSERDSLMPRSSLWMPLCGLLSSPIRGGVKWLTFQRLGLK
jgi:hypothetical protein